MKVVKGTQPIAGHAFPTPWRFDDEGDLVAADGTLPMMDDEGMAFLVKAVNLHATLVGTMWSIARHAGNFADGAPDSTAAAKECAFIEDMAREALEKVEGRES